MALVPVCIPIYLRSHRYKIIVLVSLILIMFHFHTCIHMYPWILPYVIIILVLLTLIPLNIPMCIIVHRKDLVLCCHCGLLTSRHRCSPWYSPLRFLRPMLGRRKVKLWTGAKWVPKSRWRLYVFRGNLVGTFKPTAWICDTCLRVSQNPRSNCLSSVEAGAQEYGALMHRIDAFESKNILTTAFGTSVNCRCRTIKLLAVG